MYTQNTNPTLYSSLLLRISYRLLIPSGLGLDVLCAVQQCFATLHATLSGEQTQEEKRHRGQVILIIEGPWKQKYKI